MRYDSDFLVNCEFWKGGSGRASWGSTSRHLLPSPKHFRVPFFVRDTSGGRDFPSNGEGSCRRRADSGPLRVGVCRAPEAGSNRDCGVVFFAAAFLMFFSSTIIDF